MTNQDQRKGEQFSCTLLSRWISVTAAFMDLFSFLWNSWLVDLGEQNNIATAENNTSLRYGVSYDWSHNMRCSQSGFYVTNYTRPIPFKFRGSVIGSRISILRYFENSGFNQKQPFLPHFAQNYTKIFLSKKRKKWGVYRPPWWNDNLRACRSLLIAWWKSHLHVTNTITNNNMETALGEFLYCTESRVVSGVT